VRYYKSRKVLGELYRRIDEKKFFTQMRDNFQAVQNTWGGESLLQKLEYYVDRKAVGVQWVHHHEFAANLREEWVYRLVALYSNL
jgi:hypothetical protein